MPGIRAAGAAGIRCLAERCHRDRHLLFLVGKVLVVLNILEDLSLQAQIELGYLDKVLKIIGVAYITELAAGLPGRW